MGKERHRIICAAYLLLVNGDQVLLLRRSNTGYEDGKYSVPAGHVEEGESVARCLIREVKEEIGINLSMSDICLKHVMHRARTEGNDERLDFFFVCQNWSGEPQNLEPHKCDELLWSPLDGLPENTIPYIRKAIGHAFSGESYSEII